MRSWDASTAASPAVDPPDAVFQAVFAVWTGFLVAGTASPVAGVIAASPAVLVVIYFAALLAGTAAAVVLARRLHGLPAWLGRPWPRRLITTVSTALLAVAGLVTLFGFVESLFGLVALGATFGVAVGGLAVARAAENRYVDAVAPDEPIAAWRWQWEQSRSAKRDLFVVLAWVFLAVGSVVAGELLAALILAGFAAPIAVFGLARSRAHRWLSWMPDTAGEVRVHEAGIVTKRPHRRTFVPWESVSHVRLRNDELVVDRGLFELRFGRDELADLEDVRAAIERRLENVGSRERT